jgi:hypothetical protein
MPASKSLSLEDFRQSLTSAQAPADLSPALQALWHEAKGDWNGAHAILQKDESANGAWVHAYLHRVEGDNGNAAYWYRRAGKPMSQQELADEWNALVRALLAQE